MELRDYISIIGRHIWVVIVIIILAILSAFFFSRGKVTTNTASSTFTVSKNPVVKQNQASYYLYDNYYNVQSADLFAQIVAKWFSAPSFSNEVYQKAGLSASNLSAKELGKSFTATYQIPATISVSITGENRETINTLMNTAAKVVQEKTAALGQGQDSYYEITNFTPVVSENKSNTKINVLIGFVSGIILGILAALGIFYFKREKLN